MLGYPPEQLLRCLDDRAPGSHQVAGAQHRQGIVGERRDHVRTVRSAARSRNRPRRQLAWLILLILAALVALAARVDAAGAPAIADDPVALAIRYADALSGGVSDPARAPALAALDEIADGDDDDREAEDLESDDLDIDDLDDDLEDERAAQRDPDDRARAGEPGGDALAMLDAELDPGDAVAAGDAVYANGTAGAAEQYEQSLRRQRPSAWGRLDVGVSWRLRQSEPMHAPAHRTNELWLVATWRR